MKKNSLKTLLLIDAHSLIHRCFHALPPMNAADGSPTNALYGVSTILFKLWKQDPPDYAAAAFDRPEPTFRKQKFDDYKAHRPPTAPDLISQLIDARKLFQSFGIPIFEQAGVEGDDIIATLAERFSTTENLRIVILTGDLDALQSVQDDRVVVRTFRKGLTDTFTYDEAAVRARFGISPSQIPDYKALVGDTSDNIPGLPGVGSKTATRLLQEFVGVRDLIKRASSVPTPLSQKIISYRDQLLLSLELATTRTDVELKNSDLSDLAIADSFPAHLADYFQHLGFASLLARLSSHSVLPAPAAPKKKNMAPAAAPLSLFSNSAAFSPVDKKRSVNGAVVFIFPSDPDAFDATDKRLSSNIPKIGFGLKEFFKRAQAAGVEISPPYLDLGIAFWLLDPDFKDAQDPAAVFKKYLKESWQGSESQYSQADAFVRGALEAQGLSRVFWQIEMPLIPILARMEVAGIGISARRLASVDRDLEKKLSDLIKKIHKLAGSSFNINSTQQLSTVLFETLKIKSHKSKKQSGYISTDADHLRELAGAHPIIEHILQYREDFKMQSTYVRPLMRLADESADGRIHTDYLQTGAATGRLSSQNPNLQNIPQESIWSKPLRSAFVASPKYSFISFDYSQLELRILAGVSGDPEMRRAFEAGEDIHRKTAAAILDIAPDAVTKEQRRMAKTLNFGLIYGMGVSAFVKSSGFTRAQAQDFINRYFKRFSSVQAWHDQIKQQIRQLGYSQTLTGRRRYFSGITSSFSYIAAEAERAGINFPLQGLGADILKLSMIAVFRLLQERGWQGSQAARLLLSIHDELLLEVRDDMIETVIGAVAPVMERVIPELPVGLVVDASVGSDWGVMRPFSR